MMRYVYVYVHTYFPSPATRPPPSSSLLLDIDTCLSFLLVFPGCGVTFSAPAACSSPPSTSPASGCISPSGRTYGSPRSIPTFIKFISIPSGHLSASSTTSTSSPRCNKSAFVKTPLPSASSSRNFSRIGSRSSRESFSMATSVARQNSNWSTPFPSVSISAIISGLSFRCSNSHCFFFRDFSICSDAKFPSAALTMEVDISR
mmetsp:Transcript_8715/g.21136  ORF Transcript_8715/g.21136 Transcript_8715/m.21136 type:complete len:203 (+) Transcript_8715:531-1139(+)